MKQKTKKLLAGFAIAMSATTQLFAEEISLDRVPQKLRDIAANYVPGAAFSSANIEIENGRRIYEIAGVNSNGRRVEVDLFEDGSLDEIEMEETEADLPAAVKSALVKVQPDGKIVKVETSVHADSRFFYEVEVRTPSGAVIAYELSEDGRIVSVEDAATS